MSRVSVRHGRVGRRASVLEEDGMRFERLYQARNHARSQNSLQAKTPPWPLAQVVAPAWVFYSHINFAYLSNLGSVAPRSLAANISILGQLRGTRSVKIQDKLLFS